MRDQLTSLSRKLISTITTQKVQIQEAMKNYYGEKSKAKAAVPTSTQNSKLFNKARKDKKKK